MYITCADPRTFCSVLATFRIIRKQLYFGCFKILNGAGKQFFLLPPPNFRMSSTISPFGMGSPSSGMVAFSVLVSMLAVNVATADFDMVLIHTNDMHSRFDETDMYCNECREDDSIRGLCYGGFARIAHAVKTERRLASEQGLPSLFMVAGDTFQGTPYFSYFKWRPVVDFVKELQPDIMVTYITRYVYMCPIWVSQKFKGSFLKRIPI